MSRPLQGGWWSSPGTSQPPGPEPHWITTVHRHWPASQLLASTHWTPDRTEVPHSLQHQPCAHSSIAGESGHRLLEPGDQQMAHFPRLFWSFGSSNGLLSPGALETVQHLNQQDVERSPSRSPAGEGGPQTLPPSPSSSRCRSTKAQSLQLGHVYPRLSPLVANKHSRCRRHRARPRSPALLQRP